MSPYLTPPSPAQIRAALIAHFAGKLGWSGRTAALLLNPLTADDLVACLRTDVEATREALFARMCRALRAAVDQCDRAPADRAA